MSSLTDLARTSSKFIIDNSPSLLTAVGVTGTVTTAYLTGKASWKSAIFLTTDATQEELDFLDFKLRTKLVWKFYIPAVATGAMTVVAIIGANRIGVRRAAALASAFSLSERAWEEYRTKVIEKVGRKDEELIRDQVVQDRVARATYDSEIVLVGGGTVPCYDAFTSRYFVSSAESLRAARNEVNHKVLTEGYASLNDFYYAVGLEGCEMGNEVGWRDEQKLMDIRFTSHLTSDNNPCLAASFTVEPVRNYWKFQG